MNKLLLIAVASLGFCGLAGNAQAGGGHRVLVGYDRCGDPIYRVADSHRDHGYSGYPCGRTTYGYAPGYRSRVVTTYRGYSGCRDYADRYHHPYGSYRSYPSYRSYRSYSSYGGSRYSSGGFWGAYGSCGSRFGISISCGR